MDSNKLEEMRQKVRQADALINKRVTLENITEALTKRRELILKNDKATLELVGYAITGQDGIDVIDAIMPIISAKKEEIIKEYKAL